MYDRQSMEKSHNQVNHGLSVICKNKKVYKISTGLIASIMGIMMSKKQ